MADGSPPPASPARQSTASSSSTNPNTPRSATPEDCEAVKKHVVEARHSPESSSSSSPGDGGHGIEPTWPRAIDETKVFAQAKWADNVLPNLLLDLHWHPTSHKAFFKLRTWIPSPGGSRRRDARTTIYLFIYPERIKELLLDRDPANKMFGAETIVLRFEMDRPPALVLPTAQYEPVNRAGKDVMDGLRALAAQTSFSVFAKIQHRSLALKRIQQLCAAATGYGLASLAVHASTTSLYEGRGGHVIEGDNLADPASGEAPVTDEPPPQYSGPAELPPAPRGTGQSRSLLSSLHHPPSASLLTSRQVKARSGGVPAAVAPSRTNRSAARSCKTCSMQASACSSNTLMTDSKPTRGILSIC